MARINSRLKQLYTYLSINSRLDREADWELKILDREPVPNCPVYINCLSQSLSIAFISAGILFLAVSHNKAWRQTPSSGAFSTPEVHTCWVFFCLFKSGFYILHQTLMITSSTDAENLCRPTCFPNAKYWSPINERIRKNRPRINNGIGINKMLPVTILIHFLYPFSPTPPWCGGRINWDTPFYRAVTTATL